MKTENGGLAILLVIFFWMVKTGTLFLLKGYVKWPLQPIGDFFKVTATIESTPKLITIRAVRWKTPRVVSMLDVFEASRDCFLQFLVGLFQMDPAERWTAHQALLHAFVNDQVVASFDRNGCGKQTSLVEEPGTPQNHWKTRQGNEKTLEIWDDLHPGIQEKRQLYLVSLFLLLANLFLGQPVFGSVRIFFKWVETIYVCYMYVYIYIYTPTSKPIGTFRHFPATCPPPAELQVQLSQPLLCSPLPNDARGRAWAAILVGCKSHHYMIPNKHSSP